MKKSQCVKVSIIIPIYNTHKYLSQCLESILNQTFYDMEIICIDDASTDNSYEIARIFAEEDERIILIQNDINQGLSATRNKGMKIASGDYIQFLDSDDYLEKNAIEQLYNLADINEADVIFFGAKILGKQNEYNCGKLGYKEKRQFCSGLSFFKTVNEKNEYQSASCFQFWNKRYLVDNSLFFQEGIVYEDTLFTLNAVLKAKKLIIVPELFYVYRERSDSISHSLGKKQLASCVMVYYGILKIWTESSVPDEIEEGIRKRLDLFERRIRYVLGIIKEKPKLDFDDPISKYIYEMFCKMQPVKSLYINNLSYHKIERLRVYDKIYLYGAGAIAKDIVKVLEENEILITGIFVTTKQEGKSEFCGYPIIAIDEFHDISERTVILLALAKKWHLDIMKKLDIMHIKYLDILE